MDQNFDDMNVQNKTQEEIEQGIYKYCKFVSNAVTSFVNDVFFNIISKCRYKCWRCWRHWRITKQCIFNPIEVIIYIFVIKIF